MLKTQQLYNNCRVWPFYNLIIHPSFFLGHLYPIAGTTSSRSDDGSSPQISLQRPFVYFGQSYNQIYVCKNNFSKLRNTDVLTILGFCHGGINISFSDKEVLEVPPINILIYCTVDECSQSQVFSSAILWANWSCFSSVNSTIPVIPWKYWYNMVLIFFCH